jgi:hypothetical protein
VSRPGATATMPAQFCTRHTSRETLRICGRCERPFCPDCLVDTPGGGRCRECAAGPKSARLRVVWWRWPLVVAVALVGGIVGGFAAGFGWLSFIICFVLGQFVGNGALRVSGRRPGLALGIVVAVVVAAGVMLSAPIAMVMSILQVPGEHGPLLEAARVAFRMSLLSPWKWIGAACMAASAWARVR